MLKLSLFDDFNTCLNSILIPVSILIIIMKFHHEEKFLKLFPKEIVRNPYIELPPYQNLANELMDNTSTALLARDLEYYISHWKKILSKIEFEVIDNIFGLTDKSKSEKKTLGQRKIEVEQAMNLSKDEVEKIKTSAVKKLREYVYKQSVDYVSLPSSR